jgi:hypothetical protein
VTASQFASKVMFTDANPAVLPLAVENAVSNGAVAHTSPAVSSCCVVDCSVLRWGVDDDVFVAKHGTFDVVIGSEVLYVLWVRYRCLLCPIRALHLCVLPQPGLSMWVFLCSPG